MAKLIDTIPTEVTEAVAESLNLFRQAQFRQPDSRHEVSQPLPSLLERCQQYIPADHQPRNEPIRLIHHFACTGGTLITKCLACSPNVQVLSELDPLSSKVSASGGFNPTDLIQLLEHGNRGASLEEKLRVFKASFSALYDSATEKGLRVLVRDHTHSQFCAGASVPDRPTLAEILADQFDILSVVTVRHPLDSWMSLVNNRWVEFSPDTFDEYAKRYLAFLAAYPATKIFKYEDFLVNPDRVLAEMCKELSLPYLPDYNTLFMAHRFSGDSGRSGDVIAERERRPISEDLQVAALASVAYRALCKQLGYET